MEREREKQDRKKNPTILLFKIIKSFVNYPKQLLFSQEDNQTIGVEFKELRMLEQP